MPKLSDKSVATPTTSDHVAGIDVGDSGVDLYLLSTLLALYDALTSTLTNKTFDADGTGNSITNVENADIKAAAAIAVNKLAALTASEIAIFDSSGFLTAAAVATYPSLAELIYLKGVTSAIQTQINSKIGAATTNTLTNKTFDANATGNALSNVDIADLAGGTDGELITWDASGVAAAVAVGTATHVLTSNGVGVAPTFQAAAGGGGAVVREGGNLDGTGPYQNDAETEATTTSTSFVDLLSLTSLTIAAAQAAIVTAVGRKTDGASSSAGLFLKINSTALNTASGPGGTDIPWSAPNVDAAYEGSLFMVFSARVTNYLSSLDMMTHTTPTTPGANIRTYLPTGVMYNSLFPNAVISTIVLQGISDSASQTLGADEAHAYSLAAS